jgi:hypothetical protein
MDLKARIVSSANAFTNFTMQSINSFIGNDRSSIVIEKIKKVKNMHEMSFSIIPKMLKGIESNNTTKE